MNNAVTIHALRRVLHHLSEPEQAKMPDYRVTNGYWCARAEARRIARRRLTVAERSVEVKWQSWKNGGEPDAR